MDDSGTTGSYFADCYENCSGGVRKCKRLAEMVVANKITSDVYFHNLLLRLITWQDSCWSAMLDTVPRSVWKEFYTYVKQELPSCDYEYSPGVFLVDFRDADELAKIKAEIRPRYLRLFDAIMTRGPQQS